MIKNAVVILSILFLAGCMVGPDYKRPAVTSPETYRSATPQPEPDASVGQEHWTQMFPDQELQEMIKIALQQNFDLRIAATRIEQARAQLGITKADQYPSVAGSGDIGSFRSRPIEDQPAVRTTEGSLQLSAFWNLDFWGKYRRASEAARAEMMATEWARREVIRTLVSDVAAGYFQLRELDLELEIAERTLASRRDSLKLLQVLSDRGLRSMVDVRQAEQLVYGASQAIPNLQRQIVQQENFLRVLMGQNPGPVARGEKLTEQPHAPQLPAGLPSSLLERRPDIHQAEQQLIAFNARIGVAKAAYFPQISLTAGGGYRSSALAALFTNPSGIFNLAASVVQPIFEGGRIKSGVQFSEAQQEEAVLLYQQAIQLAFREVSDGLIAYEKYQESRAELELLTRSAQEALKLSEDRYQAGAASYLEVLDGNTRLFVAELSLAQAQLNELLAMVEVYRALGGGWQEPAVAQAASQPAK